MKSIKINKIVNYSLNEKWSFLLSFLIIFLFAIVPLFFDLPFRDNIYLSWEGAYRMYKGQIPFKDFGLPMGYGYWLLPTISFYVFGPFLYSLIKIQVFINVVSGLVFYGIIRRFSSDFGLTVIGVLLYVISFSFYNFWPWYNHTVIVFEFISFYFLLLVLLKPPSIGKSQYVLLFISALFSFLSFFTKQDGGAFSLLINGALILYYAILNRDWKVPLVFGSAFLLIGCIFIIPVLKYEFTYWFNYGQEPHYSRINIYDFIAAFLGESRFIKLYLLFILLIILSRSLNGWNWIKDAMFTLQTILILGILFQATILQVTSYVPADSNIYYHSFMIFYVLNNWKLGIPVYKIKNLIIIGFLIVLWWSALYWKYTSRMFSSLIPSSSDSVVSMNSYTIAGDSGQEKINTTNWVLGHRNVFQHVKMPPEMANGVDFIEELYMSYSKPPKVLNMSEITPLAEILGYVPEVGTPLWYHLNVGMFDRELKLFEDRIKSDYYDIVIFENIPNLNNFFPFAIRDLLKKHYDLKSTFQAPRDLTSEVIEVYVKRENN